MRRIGIAPQGNIIPTGNGADFHEVLRHENVGRIFLKGGNANERLLVCAPSGLGSETANQYREGIQIRGTGSCERGLCRGLSRMKGNFHVRFLGEVVAVMPLPYPTSGSNAASLPDLSCGIYRSTGILPVG